MNRAGEAVVRGRRETHTERKREMRKSAVSAPFLILPGIYVKE